ncbi:MAG TPA: hypothetical protein VG435_21010 [Acidimicrobiales bacterium]|nr:hypothetical protein [Acidimicrobiales bacterium]
MLTALSVGAVIAHDPGRMLGQALWRDENWVAVTLRVPIGRLPALTSTTPLLFTALLRLTPHADPSQLRLLPLAFTVAAIWAAYLLGRQLGMTPITGIGLAAATAFAPALLLRHDLKQYTAEAFVAVLLVWLQARLERDWTRPHLLALCGALAASPLLANGAVFLAPAVVAGIVFSVVVRRRWEHLPEILVGGGAALLIDLFLLIGVDRRGDTASLRAYWDNYYVPTDHGLSVALSFIRSHAHSELSAVGLGPSLAVVVLVLLGLIALARSAAPGLTLVLPICAVEQVAAATLHQYPLWDERTSTWFTLMIFLTAVGGLVGAARAAVRLVAGAGRRARPVGLAMGVGLIATLTALAHPYSRAVDQAVRTRTPLEDVHGQTQTILADYRPGDVVVANTDAGFGLAVYWPAQPSLVTDLARLETFRVTYPPAARVVVAATISTPAELAAVDQAVSMATAGHGRVWIVLSHWHTAERATMMKALADHGRITTPDHQHGLENVMLLTLGRAAGTPATAGAGTPATPRAGTPATAGPAPAGPATPPAPG